jgi:esterase/lipase superfamily enzyme
MPALAASNVREIFTYLAIVLSHLTGNRQASDISPGDELQKDLGLEPEFLEHLAHAINGNFNVSLHPSEVAACIKVSDLVNLIASRSPRTRSVNRHRTGDIAYSANVDNEDNLQRSSKGSAGRVDADYTVWYGTNRKPIDSKDPAKGYSSDRCDSTALGRCRVFVPFSHKIGSTGSGWWKRLVRGDDRLRLLEIQQQEISEYWNSVRIHVTNVAQDDQKALIFIHGYNVSFENAALRAAQIGFDLSVKGAMAFFSWPSKGTLSGYLADGASIEASEEAIAQFLVDFAGNCGAKSVHVVAHSMGNRGMLRAVDRIVQRAEHAGAALFSQVILAAPDVDSDLFERLCKAYQTIGKRTTLYVSSRDHAVEVSQWLYDFARAGFAPPIFVAPGIDTVNVTNVDLSLLGHGYIAQSRDVLQDMFRLLNDGAHPSKRFNLRQRHAEDGSAYWEFKQ